MTSRALNNAGLGVIGFILVLTIPFLYQEKVKNIFTKQAILSFTDTGFSVESFGISQETDSKLINYEWSEIQAYRFDFTPSKFTVLDIFPKKNGRGKFIFLDNKNESQLIGEESVFSVFQFFVNEFNKEDDTNKIIVDPGFLATQAGVILLFFPAVLIIIAILLRVWYSNYYFIGFLVFGIFSLLPLIVKRQSQRKLYEKMRKFNNAE